MSNLGKLCYINPLFVILYWYIYLKIQILTLGNFLMISGGIYYGDNKRRDASTDGHTEVYRRDGFAD